MQLLVESSLLSDLSSQADFPFRLGSHSLVEPVHGSKRRDPKKAANQGGKNFSLRLVGWIAIVAEDHSSFIIQLSSLKTFSVRNPVGFLFVAPTISGLVEALQSLPSTSCTDDLRRSKSWYINLSTQL